MECKIIVESLLTASQFEVSVIETDKILMLKSSIEKILGIPASQQHLLHQQTELDDHVLMKDIPIYEGIRFKLIPSMRVGPIQSARRVLPPLNGYNSWFDINEVMNNSKRDEPLILKSKYLVNKGCKKNIHRWKLNNDRGKTVPSASSTNKYTKASSSLFEPGQNSRDDEKIKKITDQRNQTEQQMENIRTAEKMNELRLKLELANTRKKQKLVDLSSKNKKVKNSMEQLDTEYEKLINDSYIDKAIQRQQKRERYLSAETKMKIKANLTRNRSFKAIHSPTAVLSSSLMSFSNLEKTPLESISKEDEEGGDGWREIGVEETVSMRESGPFVNLNSTMSRTRPKKFQRNNNAIHLKGNLEESYGNSLLPKILVREDSAFVSEIAPLCFEDSKRNSSDEASAENITEYCDKLSSSSRSLVSYQPKNRFYHSDLDLNQLTTRFQTKLSLSNQDMKTSEGNNLAEGMLLFEENCVKWTHLDYKADEPLQNPYDTREDSEIPQCKLKTDKLKCFGSNPTLTATVSNLTATTTTSMPIHIPQISLLDSVPTKTRGYINLNDVCLSNTDISMSQKIPRPSSERKPITEQKSLRHAYSIYPCQFQRQRNMDISEVNSDRSDILGKISSGRQSRFEYCNSYYSNLDEYASVSQKRDLSEAASYAPSFKAEKTKSFDFQSEENLFNMNFDSFYEDFSANDLSWSSTTSSTSSSTTSFESNSVSSFYDKKYKMLPEIKTDHELHANKTPQPAQPKVSLLEETEKVSGQLRCFQCNKKLGIIMIMKCHCEKYFCSAHRYKEAHQCTYNYKSEGKKKLELENPVCIKQKLPKI